MKKLLILLSISLVCLVGCAGCNTYEHPSSDYNGSTFATLEVHGGYYVVYNKQTKVMYVVSNGAYNEGTFTLLVNADGTPMVYEE